MHRTNDDLVRDELFISKRPFTLETGEIISSLELDYTTIGKFNKENVVWIFPGIENEWSALREIPDQHAYFFIQVTMPVSDTFFTLKDMMRAYQLLKEELRIGKIHIGIGASMGGQLLLEWAAEEQDIFEFIFPIATNAVQSAWCIAFNTSQRLCLEMGAPGNKAARAVASLFNGETEKNSAATYYKLTKSMDSHNLGRGRKSITDALRRIGSRTFVISLTNDMLFPKQEQEFLVRHISNAELRIISSAFGHAGYIIEAKKIMDVVFSCVSTYPGTVSTDPAFFKKEKIEN